MSAAGRASNSDQANQWPSTFVAILGCSKPTCTRDTDASQLPPTFELFFVDVVLVHADADVPGFDLDEFGQRVLKSTPDGDRTSEVGIHAWQLLLSVRRHAERGGKGGGRREEQEEKNKIKKENKKKEREKKKMKKE